MYDFDNLGPADDQGLPPPQQPPQPVPPEPFNQADLLRLSKLNAGLAGLQNDMDEGILEADIGADLVRQIERDMIAPVPPRPEALTHIAEEIRKHAAELEGEMPLEVEWFLRRYGAPGA